MSDRPTPHFRTMDELLLCGTMAIYDSQAELAARTPQQWREFRSRHPELGSEARFCGASPCSSDRKIHYLTGAVQQSREMMDGEECVVLQWGEYAVVQVDDAAALRSTWTWLLESWLPASGRREKSAPEFERFTSISDAGTPLGPVEIWIPLEPVASA